MARIPESVYRQRLKALRQLERGWGSKDGYNATQLTPAQKRKINGAFSRYDSLDSPSARIIKVPRGTPEKVIESLQYFAQYPSPLPPKKVKGVLVPATIATDEKLELVPASKRKRGKSAVVYYKNGSVKTPSGRLLMPDGSVGMYERRGDIFSTNAVDIIRIRTAVKNYIKKHPDADLWDTYLIELEKELKRLEKQAGKLWYLIVTGNGPTKFGGTKETVMALLQRWRDTYKQDSDPLLFVAGLRVFLSREAYTKDHTDVVMEQRLRAKGYKEARAKQRYLERIRKSAEAYRKAKMR